MSFWGKRWNSAKSRVFICGGRRRQPVNCHFRPNSLKRETPSTVDGPHPQQTHFSIPLSTIVVISLCVPSCFQTPLYTSLASQKRFDTRILFDLTPLVPLFGNALVASGIQTTIWSLCVPHSFPSCLSLQSRALLWPEAAASSSSSPWSSLGFLWTSRGPLNAFWSLLAPFGVLYQRGEKTGSGSFNLQLFYL